MLGDIKETKSRSKRRDVHEKGYITGKGIHQWTLYLLPWQSAFSFFRAG